MSSFDPNGFRPRFETLEARDQPSVLAGDLLASTDEPVAGDYPVKVWAELYEPTAGKGHGGEIELLSFSWGETSATSVVLNEWYAQYDQPPTR